MAQQEAQVLPMHPGTEDEAPMDQQTLVEKFESLIATAKPSELKVLLKAGPTALIEARMDHIDAENRATAIKALEAKASEFGFTLKDLVPGNRNAPVKSNGPKKSPPKFRDPKTGKTWTGNGRRPGWMPENNADDHKFLIKS